jgi:UDPglucose 6-dehydrogenase
MQTGHERTEPKPIDTEKIRRAMANICIVGLWHQAMVLAACFSEMGHTVCGVGEELEVVEALTKGKPPVFEPRIPAMIRRNVKSGRLKFLTDYGEAMRDAEFVYLAIDTPVNADDSSDLSGIFDAARKIGRSLKEPVTLVVTAQVPVGTTERIAAVVREENPAVRIEAAYVPEFLRLGTAVETFQSADRFVVGADDATVAERVAALYKPLKRPILTTGLRTAEMGKHACNAYLAMSISFINEIADLSESLGADASEVAKIMKTDRRIGRFAFLSPGLGFAGGTLGREIRALQKFGEETGKATRMMDAIWEVNRARPEILRHKLEAKYGRLQGLNVAILGLTYKSGTSTLRRAISLEIIRDLAAHGVALKAYDPLVRLDGVIGLPPFLLVDNPYEAAADTDAVVLLTEWTNIKAGLDLARLKASMRQPLFIDTRNLFDPVQMKQAGFTYLGIGRGAE